MSRLARPAVIVAAALVLVVAVEHLAGPFGGPWDGLFGIALGVVALLTFVRSES